MGSAAFRRVEYSICVAAFCLTWGSAFPVGKLALTVSPPIIFLGLRFLPAAAVLFAWSAWRGDLSKLTWRDLVFLFGLGLLNQAGYNGLTWLGMETVSSGLATLIIGVNPLLVGVLGAILLRDPITLRRLMGLVLGFGGVFWVARHRLSVASDDPVGIALVIGGLLSLAVGTVAFKKWSPKVPLPLVVGAQFAASGTALLIVGLSRESVASIQLGPLFYFALAYNIAVVSLLGFLLWFFLLERGSATSVSSLQFILPPVGVALSWFILGERADLADLVGIVPVVLGIWLASSSLKGKARDLSQLSSVSSSPAPLVRVQDRAKPWELRSIPTRSAPRGAGK